MRRLGWQSCSAKERSRGMAAAVEAAVNLKPGVRAADAVLLSAVLVLVLALALVLLAVVSWSACACGSRLEWVLAWLCYVVDEDALP